MIAQPHVNEGGNPLRRMASGHGAGLRAAYAELCQLKTLERGYADYLESHTGVLSSDVFSEEAVHSLTAALGKDLVRHTYQPGQAAELGCVRDMIVQAALRLLLDPLFAPRSSGAPEDKQTVEWIAASIRRGLVRAYGEELAPSPEGLPHAPLVTAVRERVDDVEFVALFEKTLAALTRAGEQGVMAPLLVNIALSRIDQILEQAKALGRRDGILHVSGVRIGKEMLILVDGHAEYDWVIPAVQGRVRAACAEFNLTTDPERTQVVDLDRGHKLTYLDCEFRCVPGPAKERIVRCKRLGKVQEPEPEPEPEAPAAKSRSAGRFGALVQYLLSPFRRVAAAFGSVIPKFSQREAGPVTRFLSSDWQVMVATLWHGLVSFGRWLGKHWEPAAATACALCLLVIAVQVYSELPWESALGDDFPGFRTGYYSSFGSKPVEYALYVPPERADGEALPLIVFLDDSTHPAGTLQGDLAAAVRERLKAGGDFRFAVFFPGHPRDRWVTDKTVPPIMAALDDIMKRHRIDPKRVYLIGQSSDGWAVLDLAAKCPDRWAAIVAVDPRVAPFSMARARIPCWVFECTSEKRLFPVNVQALTRAFEANETEVQYTPYRKTGRGSSREVYANPKLFAWLAQKTK
jgi:hypothetical protein